MPPVPSSSRVDRSLVTVCEDSLNGRGLFVGDRLCRRHSARSSHQVLERGLPCTAGWSVEVQRDSQRFQHRRFQLRLAGVERRENRCRAVSAVDGSSKTP
jgi:hypothetical protein